MERIFYATDLVDAYSGCPIYIFDTSYLPAPEDVDYDLFIPTLMQRLPKFRYMVIMFSCGLNKINWVWGISFIKAFLSQSSSGRPNAENVYKIIAVHESWFVKSVSQIFTNFLLSKKSFSNFNSLLSSLKTGNNVLVSCGSLSVLSKFVDITKLKILLNVYRHDYQTTLSLNICLHFPRKPIISSTTQFSQKSNPIFYHHFYQIFNIVDTYADQVELLFHKPGKKVNTEILFQCLMRNQVIWINDWDLNCVASCFKKILSEVRAPLIDTKKIVLPMRDDLEYTSQVFHSLMEQEYTNVVLFQIGSLCHRMVSHNLVTKHNYVSILKCLSHALAHESLSNQNKDNISVVVRFLKNVLIHWKDIRPRYSDKFKTVQQIVHGEDLIDIAIDELYNMSYDITMQASVSSDEEESRRVNTENLISLDSTRAETFDTSASPTKPRNRAPEYPNDENNDKGSRQTRRKDLPLQDLFDNSIAETMPKVRSQNHRLPERCTFHGDSKTIPETEANTSIQVQFPPQKYKFERPEVSVKKAPSKASFSGREEPPLTIKKPVVRGRKVGELTRIFEERSQAMRILNTM